jgi:4-amino-4-deoxy-L-arabinose transferase-like glycosyltransferase
MLEKTRRWVAAHPNWALALVTVAVLTPFLAKPFNMDDPLFIWVARQIYLHPANPYGFDVNWAQTVFPMWNATENPPLACYYLALGAGFFGWSEIGLHVAFLLPALAVVLGTHRLAGHFCRRPMLAALAMLFTPVFLVSSLTVMCDMLMLAFWIWAAVLWVEGMERDDYGRLAVSGLFIAFAALTKYYGACLMPLLGAYGLLCKRRPGRWMVYLLIPLATLYVYQVSTRALYGHNLLFHAMEFTSFMKGDSGYSRTNAVLTALTFTGGCVAVAAFFAPLLWRRRALVVFGGAAVLIAAIMAFNSAIEKNPGASPWTSPTFVEFQIAVWAVAGIGVLALAIADVLHRRDARSWLLGLWVLGTFSFTAFFNWTVNGRSILPMTPAVGILIARRLEKNFPTGHKVWPQGAVISLAASATLSLLVARADFLLARAVRESARETCSELRARGRTLWFEGHWGFQYYMEKYGAMAIDLANPALEPGDTFVVPANNANLHSAKLDATKPRAIITEPKSRFLATVDGPAGAGFYASLNGPLPFAFGSVPPEQIAVFTFNGPAPAPAASPLQTIPPKN